MESATSTIPDLNGHVRLIVRGPDQPGLVERVSGTITRNGGNIISLAQYSDNPLGGHFFQRIEFHCDDFATKRPQIEADLRAGIEPLGLSWQLIEANIPKRMIVLASKEDHCLLDLLWRAARGTLPVTIPMVIANHTIMEETVRSFGVPFVHIPSQGADKSAAEAKILETIKDKADFVVLARYMQILSADFLDSIGVPVINIHHSFLPAFIGADPYRQAMERGVKLIGATAHYVTKDLDEGPIIEQETTRVNHSLTLRDLRGRGATVERTVLSRAVRWHAEDRVIRHGNHTVVFE